MKSKDLICLWGTLGFQTLAELIHCSTMPGESWDFHGYIWLMLIQGSIEPILTVGIF